MIDVYEGIPQAEIEAKRLSSEGKEYTLNHPPELVVNMRYKGTGSSSANSQGWERNSTYYFKELLKNHPEYFSKKNTIRIQNGESPRVDARFIQAFPEFSGFENEILIHHHIGKDGQAVAVPQSIHKGSGEIHVFENKLGITDNAKAFSGLCQAACENNPEMVNQTSDQFKDSLKAANQSEAEVKPEADADDGLGASKQETIESSEESIVDEQETVDSQDQEMDDDWLRQEELRYKERLRKKPNKRYFQPVIEDPVPKGVWGKTKYFFKVLWENHKEEIIVGGFYAINETGKRLYNRHKSVNNTMNRKGNSNIPMTKPPREEKPFMDTTPDISSSPKENREYTERFVPENRQRYHTKNGIEYRDKKSYISPRPDKKK